MDATPFRAGWDSGLPTIGPISLLEIRRALAEGRLYGLLSGLGVATADGRYGAIAAFGLTAITSLPVDGRRPLGLIGAMFLRFGRRSRCRRRAA